MNRINPNAPKNTVTDSRKGQNLLDLRDVNLNVLLSAIWENAPIPRVELAQRTGLAPSSITRLIRQLSSKELIIETGKGQSSGGRQPILIEPNPDAGVIVSLDLSGSKMRGGIFDAANRVICEKEKPFEGLGPEAIQQQMISLARELLDEPLVKERKLLGVGVSSPGIVSGDVHISHTLKLHNFPLKRILEETFNVPVIVQNDSYVAALAEKYYGAGRGLENFMYLLLSDGIGAGLILNGDIYKGPLESAGEIGHSIVERSGTICGCGKRGCLETVASRSAILSHAQRILDYEQDKILASLSGHDRQNLTLATIKEAAESGSVGAQEAIQYAANHVGFALVNSVTILGIRSVIIGGDVTLSLGDSFFDCLTRSVKEYNRQFQEIDLIHAQLDWRAFLQGISMLTLQQIIGINL
jgi:predicted NBD/HSP70 family sugar kinase